MHYSTVDSSLFNIHYFNPEAKLVIIGISPGPTQTLNEKYLKGDTLDIIKYNNRMCAFAGKMRNNLIKMLKAIDKDNRLQNKLSIDFDKLWGDDFDKVNHTSILPLSVVQSDIKLPEKITSNLDDYEKDFKKRKPKSQFYISNFSYKKIINSNNAIKENFHLFVNDFNKYSDDTIFIVLGNAMKIINDAPELNKNNKTIINIPHAAPSNQGKINAFLRGDELEFGAQTQINNGHMMRKTADAQILELLKKL